MLQNQDTIDVNSMPVHLFIKSQKQAKKVGKNSQFAGYHKVNKLIKSDSLIWIPEALRYFNNPEIYGQ